MTATKFPGYAEYKKIHKDWVLTHVAVMDMQYAGLFRQEPCGGWGAAGCENMWESPLAEPPHSFRY
jgi:hypothetical protein